MVDLIAKKRDGFDLTKEEIQFIITDYTNERIPDYQMSALAMAIYFKGMTQEECAHLTLAMAESGDQIDLHQITGIKVDKHSTGGVGDKTTIALAPLVASVGVPVAKMSGRGLGHTGGTLDKLEAIPGFDVELSSEKFIDYVNNHHLAVIGQTGNLTPADKKLYALRDVTATVNSIPLIASSVMSKKIAAGADAIVLDVKTGSGAFMKNIEDAEQLAKTMVTIGNDLGRKTVAIISDMNEPLGFAVGNALEVIEAIDFLRGEGPEDLRELCFALGSEMVYLAEKAESVEAARVLLEEAMTSGRALETFKTMIHAQNGDARIVDDVSRLGVAPYKIEVCAKDAGIVHAIIAEQIGVAAMMLGAGRDTKDSTIDLNVGIMLKKKIGDYVNKGEVLAVLHANESNCKEIMTIVLKAFTISSEPVQKQPIIYKEIRN